MVDAGYFVAVKYTGWLETDGKVGNMFETNADTPKKLFRFQIGAGSVIKGWEEGVKGMKKGGKRLIVIPPQLGYGMGQTRSAVPPNSTLLFEVEIQRIKKGTLDATALAAARAASTPSSTTTSSVVSPELPPALFEGVASPSMDSSTSLSIPGATRDDGLPNLDSV